MTSAQTVRDEERLETKTLHEKSIPSTNFSSLYHQRSDNFQKQIKKSVKNRCELAGSAYLEYVQLCKSLADSIWSLDLEFLKKSGFKIDPHMYENMLNRYWEIVSDTYSNQTRIQEELLKIFMQNTKLIRSNLSGFMEMMHSNYVWMIPSSSIKVRN